MNIPQINRSTFYNNFKFTKYNRSIYRNTVEKLKKEYKNEDNFAYFPILVDSEFTIIDGQHRYTACKELGLPIYYIIKKEKKADANIIRSVNKAGRNHSILDIFTMEYKLNNPEALKVKKLHDEFNNKINVTTMLSICEGKSNSGSLRDRLINKTYKTRSISDCRILCKFLLLITNEKSVSQKIYNSFVYISKQNKIYDIDLIEDCVKKYLVLDNTMSKVSIINRIIDTYNYRRKTDQRIYFK